MPNWKFRSLLFLICLYSPLSFPDTWVGKESTCNAEDPGLTLGLGKSPGEGKGYPLQCSVIPFSKYNSSVHFYTSVIPFSQLFFYTSNFFLLLHLVTLLLLFVYTSEIPFSKSNSLLMPGMSIKHCFLTLWKLRERKMKCAHQWPSAGLHWDMCLHPWGWAEREFGPAVQQERQEGSLKVGQFSDFINSFCNINLRH